MEHKTENLGNVPTTGGDVWAQARNNQRVSTLIRRANSPRLADLVGTDNSEKGGDNAEEARATLLPDAEKSRLW